MTSQARMIRLLMSLGVAASLACSGVLDLEDDMAELIQHEVDHLDGILTIHRAVGAGAIVLRAP